MILPDWFETSCSWSKLIIDHIGSTFLAKFDLGGLVRETWGPASSSASLFELHTFRVWLGDVETSNLGDMGNRAQCDGTCLMAWQKCAMQHMFLMLGASTWPGWKHDTGKLLLQLLAKRTINAGTKMVCFAGMSEEPAKRKAQSPRYKLERAASRHYKKWFLRCMSRFSGHAPPFLTSIFEDAS